MRGRMRRSILAAIVMGIAIRSDTAAQPRRSGISSPRTAINATTEGVDRLERWLHAIDTHEPGEADTALDEVASWSTGDLRMLWADVKALTTLLRNRNATTFLFADGGRTILVVYSPSLIRRLRALACASAGRLADVDCIAIRAVLELGEPMRRLAEHAAADRARTGEDNYILRRAAILHADVEVLAPAAAPAAAPSRQTQVVGPKQIRVDTSDGVSLDVREVGIHWELGRTVLDLVIPRGAERPQPGRDAMVRGWYRASAAWMQHIESHDTMHIDRAREIFPSDPDVLFLSGTLHETYAGPAIQSAARAAVVPSGFSLDILPARLELRRAESFLRGAIAHAPDMAEAHLRLGRVLGLQGQHAEAIASLRRAVELLTDDDELRYDAELFAGAEEEALGRFDAAREAYERARALFPSAQSPLLALSQLARRRGDRAGAFSAIQRLFALPPQGAEGRDDPFWAYHTAQARNAESLIEEVRAPFRRAAP